MLHLKKDHGVLLKTQEVMHAVQDIKCSKPEREDTKTKQIGPAQYH